MTERPDACPHCGYVLIEPVPPPPARAPSPVPSLPVPSPQSYVPLVPPYPAHAPAPLPLTNPPTDPPTTSNGGLSAASVPKILLGLGATCLLVAAVIFLAVAWSWLGIGGRTTVLVVLTLTTALAGQWCSRRDLGVAAEALTIVSLGLLVLDLVGARRAGWLAVPTEEAFLTVLGCCLLGASLTLLSPTRKLFAPQLAAPLGVAVAAAGLIGATWQLPLVLAGTVLCYAGLVSFGRALALALLPWTAMVCGLLAFCLLSLLAGSEAMEQPSLRWMWLESHGLWLVVVAALALLPWPMVPGHDDVRQLACALSASILTATLAVPTLDEGPAAITLAAAAGAAFWAVTASAAPLRWYAVPRVPLVGSLLVLGPVPVLLVGQALENLVSVAEPFTAGATVRLDPETHVAHPLLLPLGVAAVLLAAALTVPRPHRFGPALVAIAGATAVLTAAQYPLPLVVFVAVLGPFGVALALPSAVLTLVTLAEIVVLAALAVRRPGTVAAVAALVLPVALGLFLWTGGHVVGVSDETRSLAVLALLGLLALAVPRPELATGAALTVLFSSALGVEAATDPSVSAAVHLTLAGALVTTAALLRAEHHELAWPGGLLLAAATWVRLYDVGVQAPEPYTLPTAVALVLVGLHRMHRHPGADSLTALLPGLALAIVPSLLWALAEPMSTRAALLGVACLAVLLSGTALRWTAPVLVGWAAGGLLVLRELAPYAAQTPQWLLIGTAGAVLICAGITWEARVRDLRQAAAYIGRLR